MPWIRVSLCPKGRRRRRGFADLLFEFCGLGEEGFAFSMSEITERREAVLGMSMRHAIEPASLRQEQIASTSAPTPPEVGGMRIPILICAVSVVLVGCFLRSQAYNWSIFETKLPNGTPYTGVDSDKQAAFILASYCMTVGGSAIVVFSALSFLISSRKDD